MVAIFTGIGAGFERGSRAALGSVGLLGSSSFGRDGQDVFVNAANGNLVISDRDEFLVGRGPDSVISRTYNSYGALDENGDHWRQSTDRRVFGLTGTVNTTGSTIVRLSADGSEILYQWNGSAYIAREGEGATDQLTYASSVWTWEDGDTQVTETYGAYGTNNWRITAQTDSDGNALTFTYTSDKLTQVTTADGAYTAYTWSGSNITTITTGYTNLVTSSSSTLTRTRYSYDGQNRLSVVTVDLTPEDNSVSDGAIYTTTYTYHGSSKLIASITQTDGAQLSITYDSYDRVTQIVQAVASGDTRTTTIAYSGNETVVTDPQGQATTLRYNASGQLIKITAPPAQTGDAPQTVEFEYEVRAGNLLRWAPDTIQQGEANLGTPIDWDLSFGEWDGRESLRATKPYGYSQPWDGWNNPGSVRLAGGDRPDGTFSVTPGETVGYSFRGMAPAYLISELVFLDDAGSVVSKAAMHWNGSWWGWTTNTGISEVPAGAASAYIDVRSMDWGTPTATWTGFGLNNVQFVKLPAGATTVSDWPPTSNLMRGTDLSAGADILTAGRPASGGSPVSWVPTVGTVSGFEAITMTKASGYLQSDWWYDAGSFLLAGGDRPDGSFSVREGDTFTYRVQAIAQGAVEYVFTEIEWLDASGDVIGGTGGSWQNAGGWIEHTGSGWAPIGAVAARVHVTPKRWDTPSGSTSMGVAIRDPQVYITPPGYGSIPTLLQQPAATKLTRVTHSSGAETAYSYDENGNIAAITNANGTTVHRLYDANNNLIRERVVGANAGSSATALYTRYVYDGENHLRYEISPEGRVTEYLYTTPGQLEFTKQYTAAAHLYAIDDDVPSLATMDSWRNGLADRSSVRTQQFSYDLRGNVSEIRSWGIATSGGATSSSEGYASQLFTYDQAGQLLNRHVDLQATETFVYDGMGRVILSTDLAGGTTRIFFDDDDRTTVVTTGWSSGETADSYITTSVYNKAGDLVTRTDSGSSSGGDRTNGGTSTYIYDKNGQVRKVTDATGNNAYFLYDKTGRKLADIGHAGQLTEYRYDAAGRLIATVRYANLISGGDLTDLSNLALDIEIADIRPTTNASDIRQWSVYDTGGRVIETITGDGSVTRYQYDNADRLIATTSYYNKLTVSGFISTPPTTLTLPSTHAKDAVSRVFYDGDGRVVGALNAEGGLSRIFYDGAGQKIREIAYATPAQESLRASGTFNALLAAIEVEPALDLSTRYVYDGQGLLRWTVDALNRVVEYVYWEDTTTFATGLVRKTIVYATAMDVLSSYDYASVKAEVATLSSGSDRITHNVYNDRAQLAYTVDALGAVIAFTYDSLGRVIKTRQFASTATMSSMGDDDDWKANLDTWASSHGTGARISRTYYTERGEIAYIVDAEGFGTAHAYDDEGRLVSQSRYATAISVSDGSTIGDVATALTGSVATTTFTYDSLGRAYEVTDAVGTVTRTLYYATGTKQSVTVAQGQGRDESRVAYLYDTAGKLLQTIYAQGATEEASESYTYDGLGNMITRTDANSGVTTFTYDKAGRVLTQTNPMSGVTQYGYDTLGRAVVTVDPRGARSYTYFDQLNRVAGSVDAEGYVTRTTYTAFGEVASVTRYANKETPLVVQTWFPGGGYEFAREAIAGDLMITARNTGGEKPGWSSYALGGEFQLREGDRSDGRISVTAGDTISFSIDVRPLASGVIPHAKIVFLLADNSTTEGAWTDGWSGGPETLTNSMVAPTNAVAVHITMVSFRPDANPDGVFDFAFTDIAILKNGVNAVQPKPRVITDGDDATTSFQYDKLGRLTRSTDATGAYDEFTLDAFGQRTSVRNKLGGVTTNTYDKRGFLTEEVLPIATHNNAGVQQSTTVANRFEYDAYGNRTKMIEAATLANQRTTIYAYDAIGRVVSKTGDAISVATAWNSGVSSVTPSETYVYDRRGNVIESRDAAGAATFYWYDKLDRLTHTVSPLGTLARNFYDDAGNLTEARVYATLLSSIPSNALGTAPSGTGAYRSTEYAYDALNRMTESRVPDVEIARYTSSLAVTTQDLVTTFEYDAAGNVVRTTDANGGQTWSWYDKLGRKTTQIDSGNYRTNWSYDPDGNVVEERRYSTVSSAPSSTSAPPSAPSTTADDRVTTFTYDKMGRRTGETRASVKVHDGSGAHTSQNATISYTYNGLGQVTQKTEATGDTISYTYDVGGRLTMEQRSAFTDFNGVSQTPTVDYVYNGLGDVARSRQWGTTGAAERITKYTYGAGGRLSSAEDAEGFVRDYVYDKVGRVIREEYTLGSDRSAIARSYDVEGRVTEQGVAAYISSAWGRSGLDYVSTSYNAFGEAETRSLNGTAIETLAYDNAGHVWRTMSDGVWKYFMYDAVGNQTLAVASAGMNIANQSLSWVRGQWANTAAIGTTNVTGIISTITKYDARNQATLVLEPQREVFSSGSPTLANLSTQRAYNAFGEVSYEINTGGYQIDYVYNTMGRVIEIQSPTVSITLEDGSSSSGRPTEHRYYDKSGRLVASRDANGNLTRQTLLAGSGYGGSEALVTTVTTADGGVVTTKYDIHGEARSIEDQIGRDTYQNFDRMGRVLDVTNPAGLVDYYRYDGLGQQIQRWNSQLTSSNMEVTAYDRQGRIVSLTAMGGDVTTHAYAQRFNVSTSAFEGWRETTTYANSKTLVEDTDQFGRAVSTTDLGGNVSALTYDNAGRVTQRSGAVNLNYTYYNTGRVAEAEMFSGSYTYNYYDVGERWRLTKTTYGYDQTGNLVSQYYRANSVYIYGEQVEFGEGLYYTVFYEDPREHLFSSATATYDGLGRMLTWTEASGYELPAGTITYSYDANSNIRRSNASFTGFNSGGTAVNTAATQDYWFRFDALNRVVTEKGALSGGAIVRSTTGNDITYDLAGQRRQVLNNSTREDYEYDAGGRLQYVYINASGTGSQGALRAEYEYDTMGRQTKQTDYQTSSAIAYQKMTTFNAKGQITTDTTITQHPSQVDKTISTYSYGSGSSYALGQVVSSSIDVYIGSTYQHTATEANTYEWGESAFLKTSTYTQPSNKIEKIFLYNNIGDASYATIGGQKQLTNIKVEINDINQGTWAEFTNDMQGQAIHRREFDYDSNLDPNEFWHRFGGKQIGYVSNNGTIDTGYGQSITNRMAKGTGDLRFGSTTALVYNDFDQSLSSINSYEQGSTHGSYTARQGESLASIAANLWGDSSLWYKLAQANGLTAQSTLSDGQTLTIPAGVYKSTYNASTFTPYDPTSLIGDPAPTSLPIYPKPKKDKCGGLGQILLTVVAVAVTVLTQQYWLTDKAFAAFGAASGVASGAASAAVGSIASQSVGVATGIQDKFSWNAVAATAISGGVGGGLGSVEALSAQTWEMAAVRGALGSAISQGVGMAVGLQSKFSWAGVAAAGVGAGIGDWVGGKIGADSLLDSQTPANIGLNLVKASANSLANAATRSVLDGTDFGDNIRAALPDVIGSTIGEAVAGKMAFNTNTWQDTRAAVAAAKGVSVNEVPDSDVALIINDVRAAQGNDDADAFERAQEALIRMAARSRGLSDGEVDYALDALRKGKPTYGSAASLQGDLNLQAEVVVTGSPNDVHPALLFDVADTIAFQAGGFIETTGVRFREVIDSNPGLGLALTGLDLGLMIAGGPVKAAISAAYNAAGDTVRQGASDYVEGIFDRAGYAEASLTGATGTVAAVDLIAGGTHKLLESASELAATSALKRTLSKALQRRSKVVEVDGYFVGPHGGQAKERGVWESHHGESQSWAKANIPGYSALDAPTVRLSYDDHQTTREIYPAWLAEQKAKFGDDFRLRDASPQSTRELANRQFDAISLPNSVRAEYWRQYDAYIGSLPLK